jgi:hypothetical protein
MFIILFLLDDKKIHEAQKHMDPDPVPQHCIHHVNFPNNNITVSPTVLL